MFPPKGWLPQKIFSIQLIYHGPAWFLVLGQRAKKADNNAADVVLVLISAIL